jgi:hypothetical protein
MRRPSTWAVLAVLGTLFAIFDNIGYGTALVADSLGAVLPFGAAYVGALPMLGQLLGVATWLALRGRVGRRAFAAVGGAVATLAVAVMAMVGSGAWLALALAVAAAGSVAQFAVWSAALDAVAASHADEPRRARERAVNRATAVVFTPYTLGLYGLSEATDRAERWLGLSGLWGAFALALALATVLIVGLCPRGREIAPKDDEAPARAAQVKAGPLLIAAVSGAGLMMIDSQITGLFVGLGLGRSDAALSALAMPIGGTVALVLILAGRHSARRLLLVGAILVAVAFVLGGLAGLTVAVAGAVAAGIAMHCARVALEAGTSLTSMLVPTLGHGAAFMAAVQAARAIGKLTGTLSAAATIDAHRSALAAHLTIMGLGALVALVGIIAGAREQHARHAHRSGIAAAPGYTNRPKLHGTRACTHPGPRQPGHACENAVVDHRRRPLRRPATPSEHNQRPTGRHRRDPSTERPAARVSA